MKLSYAVSFGVVTMLIYLSYLLAHDTHAKVQFPIDLGIGVDVTVKDKRALTFQVRAIEERLLAALKEDPKRFLDARISLFEINDKGENTPVFVITFPSSIGRYYQNIRKGTIELHAAFEKYHSELKQRSFRYKQSLYVEAVARALRDYREIAILGDMNLVDSHCNFERENFCPPLDLRSLTKGKTVAYCRIPIPGQEFSRAQKVDRWWNISLWGTNSVPNSSGCTGFGLVTKYNS